MPAQPTAATVALSLIYLGLISTVLAAWFWAIMRLATGRGLLPPAPVRVVPWRGKHVLGMLLLYRARRGSSASEPPVRARRGHRVGPGAGR